MLAFGGMSDNSRTSYFRGSRSVSTSLSGAPTPPHTPPKTAGSQSDVPTSCKPTISHSLKTSTLSQPDVSQSYPSTPDFDILTPPQSARTSLDVSQDVGELFTKIIEHRQGDNVEHRLELSVPLATFNELHAKLEHYPGQLRYNYDYMNEKIISYPNPSAIHESTCRFFRENMSGSMKSYLSQIDNRLVWGHRASQTTKLSRGSRRTHDKGADDSFYVRIGRRGEAPVHPAFVVEVGYAEAENELLKDAEDWLCDSDGEVLAVLIVNFTKPALRSDFPDITKWAAFMQVYVQRCVCGRICSGLVYNDSDTSYENADAIVKSGPRIDLLPESGLLQPLDIPIDYILTPLQMDELQLTEEQRSLTFSVDLEEMVDDIVVAIDLMWREMNPSAQSTSARKKRKRRLSREGVEEAGSEAQQSNTTTRGRKRRT
jgi:hypothetical protein